jgi:hypothetical protein
MMRTLTLIIPEPVPFYSQEDETHFFRWLKRIRSIMSVDGVSSGLQLVIALPISNADIGDLGALMQRYDLDMSSLESLCDANNEQWFKSQDQYWYPDIYTKRKLEKGDRRPKWPPLQKLTPSK